MRPGNYAAKSPAENRIPPNHVIADIKELPGYEDYRTVPTSGELICAMRRFMRELIVEIHANFCDSPVIEDEDEAAECYELWNGMRRKLGSYCKGCVSHSVISIYITRGPLKGGKECAIF